MNIYYFCNHPYPLVIMDSISKIFKIADQDITQHLILVKHRYFNDLAYSDFIKEFDTISYLPSIDYKRNIFKNIVPAFYYLRNLKKINILNNSVVFTISYSDLATNIFCKFIKENKQSIKIIHFTIYGNFLDVTHGKFTLVGSLFDNMNIFLFKGNYLKTYTDSNNIIVERIYLDDPHDEILLISHEQAVTNNKYKNLPYPIIETHENVSSHSKIIFFFGDTTLLKSYKIDRNSYFKYVGDLLSALESKYIKDGAKIIYKPHPQDKDEIPKELLGHSISLFNEKLTAEMIFSKYRKSILAVYSICSTTSLTASHLGIPAYIYYKNCGFNNDAIYRFKSHFLLANKNYLFDMNSVNDIGKIDNNKLRDNLADNQKLWLNYINKI